MDIFDLIGIIGTIVTIYSTYLAINAKKEAKISEVNAKTAQQKTEQARDLVIHKQNTTSLATLLNETKRVQKVFFKYSNANITRGFDGIDSLKDAEELQTMITVFNEARGMITEQTELDSTATYTNLNDLHNQFCIATSNEQLKEFGHQIRLGLDDIIYKIQNTIEKRNSQI